MSERLNNLVRHFFRAYRKGPIPLGHSLIRRSVNSILDQEQEKRILGNVRCVTLQETVESRVAPKFTS